MLPPNPTPASSTPSSILTSTLVSVTTPSTCSSPTVGTSQPIAATLSSSLSLVDSSKDIVPTSSSSSFMDTLPSTKDLESCVSNILKSSMGADLIPIPSTMSAPLSEGIISQKDNSVTITPTLPSNTLSHQSEKHEEHPLQPTGRPKSAEGRTPPPPPKSYSPLFQLPLPPLFSIDSNSNKPKETHSIKGSFQPINLQLHLDEKRHSDILAARAKSRSPSGKTEKMRASSEEPIPLDSSTSTASSVSKYDIAELASKSKRRELSDAGVSSSGYLDLSMIGSKEAVLDTKGKKSNEELVKKESKEPKMSTADVASWFAQAKLMQEAFSIPPHERENPFARAASPATHRDVPPLFSSDFLTSQWNPLLKGGYHPSLAFASDSKPTYHSDVPLLLKKQEDPTSKDPVHEARETSKKLLEEQHHHLQREFRLPPEYKDRKDDARSEHHRKQREMRARDVRSSPFDDRDFKEPRMLREHRSLETADPLKETKEEVKISHSIRDLQETARRDFWEVKETPPFEEMESESQRDVKEPKECRDYREIKDHREISIGVKDVRELREVRREPRELRDIKESKEFREMGRERRDIIDPRETRDSLEIRDHRDIRDPWGEIRDHRSETLPTIHVREDLREFRKSYDHSDGKVTKTGQDHREGTENPVNLSDLGAPKDTSAGFRNVKPMDMSTFKIKRDLLHPEGRHFIEPTGIKRHHPDPLSTEVSRTVIEYPDSTRDISSRSPKEAIMNLSSGNSSSSSAGPSKDPFDSKAIHQTGEQRVEGERVGGFSGSSLIRDPPHETREPIPKGLINLIDPKNLLETREYREMKERLEEASKSEREERTAYPPAPPPQTQRRLFPEDDEGAVDAREGSSSATPPIYVPHRPTSAEEPMDYE